MIRLKKLMVKRNICWILTLAMVMSLVVIPSNNVYATNVTADQAIAWVQSQVGKALDVDGAYGAQCVDLIMAYYDYLGVPRASGNAVDYTTNALPSGWQRIKGAQPQKGDILVYTEDMVTWQYMRQTELHITRILIKYKVFKKLAINMMDYIHHTGA